MMTSFHLHTDAEDYTAWLVCVTADQKVALVASGDRQHWINMSMPYPMLFGDPPSDVWCPPGREEACFEVWSSPRPER